MEKKIVDARGLACPLPVVNAKKAAEELHTGDVLTVMVDNEIAVQNLQRFASHKGFGVSAEKKADKEYIITMNIVSAQTEKVEEEAEEIHFGGTLEEIWDESGKMKLIHKDYTTVIGIPRDMLITGYDSNVVNTLRPSPFEP